MGSPPEDAAAAASPAAQVPPSPAMMALPPEWAAYFASIGGVSAAPPAFFSPAPVAWAGQPMIPPFGAAGIPFSPVFFAHPGTPYQNAEPEEIPSDGKDHWDADKHKGEDPGRSADGAKVTSGSVDDDDAAASGETGSEGSSATRDGNPEPQDLNKSIILTTGNAFTEGEVARPTPESSHSGRVSKLPVSAPGRATLPGPETNLNIGLNYWNAPQAGAVEVAPNIRNINTMDERVLRREKRKQSNRESAKRSRMRKQQECEELSKRVAEVTGENNIIKIELERSKKDTEILREENLSLLARMEESCPHLLTTEEKAFLRVRHDVSASQGSRIYPPT